MKKQVQQALLRLSYLASLSLLLWAQATHAQGIVTQSWATLVSEANPRAIAIDASGNVYTANLNLTSGNPTTVSKITPSGVVTQTWATIVLPGGITDNIAIDASGNVYTANYNATNSNGTVSKITPAGVVTQSWAVLASSANPTGIAIDPSGNVYISNGNNTVSKITSAGVITQSWAVLASGANPTGIAIDASGNFYTANKGNHTVSKITSAGVVTQSWAALASGASPVRIAIDASGNVYTVNQNGTVSKITPAGVVTQSWAVLASGANPKDIAIDASGNVYTLNYNHNTVSNITSAGVVTQSWAALASGSNPFGIAIDASGNVYTANLGRQTVSKITPCTPGPPSVAITASPSGSITAGTSVTFTATPTNGGTTPTYQWQKGGVAISGATAATYTSTTLENRDVITCVMTPSAEICLTPTVTSNAITITLICVGAPVTPSVAIAASPSGSITLGTSVTFTATPTNGGTRPSYQWKKGSTNVGTNSATYIDAALANGDVISCVMTSNDPCASPTTATSNSITMTVISSPGAALNFDGVNDFVSVPHNAAFNITGAISVETWIKTSATDERYIVTKGGTMIYMGINGGGAGAGKLTIYIDGVTSAWTASNATVADGTWHHVAFTRNGTTLKLYVDGVLDKTVTVNAANITTNSNPFTIGTRNAAQYFNGSMDEFRIWNRELSQCEIQNNRNCELGSGQTGLVAYYKFNQGTVNSNNASITSLTDASGNNNTGTLTNFGLTGTTSNWVGIGGVTTGTTCTATGPAAPSVSIVANPSGSITAGTSVTFTATPTNGGTTPTYQWQKGGVAISGATAATYTSTTLANADVITCVMTPSAEVCVSTPTATSNAITITITCGGSPVTPSVSIAASPSGSITLGTSVTFTATPTNGGTTPSYQWKKGSTNVGTNSATYIDAALANGDVISCVMTSSDPCASPTTATSNSIIMTVTSSPGAALNFDGINDLAFVPHKAAFNITGAISVETWIKTSATDERYIITKNGAMIYMGINGSNAGAGKLTIYIDGVTSAWTASNATVADGNWHHVAFTRNGTTLKLYVDGVLDKTATVNAANITTNSSPFTIGIRAAGYLNFNGSMDELRIWNRELSQCEIQNNMNCELGSGQTGLVAYYKFNQGTANSNNASITSLTDASGNNNTGTLINFGLTGTTSNWVATGGVTTGTTCTPYTGFTWTGSTSTNWSTPSNWSCGVVPSSNDNVVIPTTTNKPMLPANQTIANLSLTGTNKVMLGNSTLCVNTITGGSASSYIVTDGTGSLIIKALSTSTPTTFPIGASETSYDPLSIRPTNSVDFTAKVKATTIAGDFTGSIANFAKTAKRQWDITPSATAGSTVLTLTNGGTAYTVVGTPKVGHYSGTAWTELAATHNNSTWTATTSSFSPFGVGEAGGFVTVLPVELLTFTGYNKGGVNILNWETAHEVNNKGFEIERLKDNTWEVLGFKTANNKSSTYQFLDVTPSSGTGGAYYRLRQMDNDGTETLSKVISIVTKGNAKLNVYPNPVSNVLTIENTEGSDFQIINLLGQTVTAKTSARFETSPTLVDVSALPQGTYFLKVGNEQVKFIKQE